MSWGCNMIDYVLIYFGGVITGLIVQYMYEHYRTWKLDDIVDLLDKVKENKHFQNHIKAYLNDNPKLKAIFGKWFD